MVIKSGELTSVPRIPAVILVIILVALTALAARPVSAGERGAAGRRSDDTITAQRLFASARAGDARAQAMLGFMFATGRGVPQHFVSATAWYRRAAEQGDPWGQYQLGLMYDKGQGVPQDAVLAHKWLILATAHAGLRQRDYYARLRDAVASKMSLAQIALAQQLALEWTPKPER